MIAAAFIPYERLPAESPQAWAAFTAYRDLGPSRSIAKAAHAHGRHKVTWEAWSRQHDWVARVAAWDAEMDRARREELLEAQRKMIRVHAEAAAKVRAKAMSAVAILDDLDPDQALRWLVAAVKIEQTSIGLPTERTKIDVAAAKDTDSIYFDALPRDKLLALGREALDVLQRQEGATDGISDDEHVAGEDE